MEVVEDLIVGEFGDIEGLIMEKLGVIEGFVVEELGDFGGWIVEGFVDCEDWIGKVNVVLFLGMGVVGVLINRICCVLGKVFFDFCIKSKKRLLFYCF